MRQAIRSVLLGLAAIVASVVVLDTALIAVFRTRWRPGIDAVRSFNRSILNPLMLRRAGTAGWYASAIDHAGRRSGTPYTTPILAVHADGQVVIPLPYGTEADWCRNVLASGEAVLRTNGVRHDLVDPEVVDADDVMSILPSRLKASFTVYGVRRFLRLKRLRVDQREE